MDPYNYFKYAAKLVPKKYKWRTIAIFISDSIPVQINYSYMDDKLNDLFNAEASVVPHVKIDPKKVKLRVEPQYQKGEWYLVKKHNQKSATYVVHEVKEQTAQGRNYAALFDELCAEEQSSVAK